MAKVGRFGKKHELIYKQIKVENSTVGNALNIFVNYENDNSNYAASNFPSNKTYIKYLEEIVFVVDKISLESLYSILKYMEKSILSNQMILASNFQSTLNENLN